VKRRVPSRLNHQPPKRPAVLSDAILNRSSGQSPEGSEGEPGSGVSDPIALSMGSETIQFVTSLVSAIDDEARRRIERQLCAEPE
jgi:hypothetical protein